MTHSATGLSGAWAAASKELPKTALYALTDEEWFQVRTARGAALTGQTAFRVDSEPIEPGNLTYVRGTGKTYYWCYGQQPDKKTIELIARDCPVEAAHAYLAVFKRVPPGTWPVGFVHPVRHKKLP